VRRSVRAIVSIVAPFVAVTVFPASGHAQDEAPIARAAPPLPPLALGTTAFLDAEGGPGTLLQINMSAYVADRVIGADGRLPVDFRQDAEVMLIHVAHTSRRTFLGANLGAEVLLPAAHVRVRADEMRESVTGIGDALVGVYLQWSDRELLGRPFAARADLDIGIPTGSHDAGRTVNLGSKAWQISPYLAWTWRVADRWEISNRINYNWSSTSRVPPRATGLRDWQAGEQLAVNLSASYEISPRWRIGAGGYMLQQLSDSRADGIRLRGARQAVYALGPGLRWSQGRTMIIGNAYKEFGARNRSEGYQAVLRLLRIF